MLIEVIRNDVGPLARRRWVFSVTVPNHQHDGTVGLRLLDYVEETRPSRRHRKWRAISAYSFGRWPLLAPRSIEAPPCPADVKAEALEQLIKRVEVMVG